MNRIYIGKFVSTHGIKGELKLLSDFDKKENVYKKDFSLYINTKEYKIETSRPHKQYELIKLNGYDNINDVLFLVGSKVYINKEDLKLSHNEYLLNDLLDAAVIDGEENLGKIMEVMLGVNNIVRVKNNDKEFLIPLIDEYIVRFDQNEKVLYTKNAKNLIL